MTYQGKLTPEQAATEILELAWTAREKGLPKPITAIQRLIEDQRHEARQLGRNDAFDANKEA